MAGAEQVNDVVHALMNERPVRRGGAAERVRATVRVSHRGDDRDRQRLLEVGEHAGPGLALDRREVPSHMQRLWPDREREEPMGDGPAQRRRQSRRDVTLEAYMLMPDGEAVPGEDELLASRHVALGLGAVIGSERAAQEVLAAGSRRPPSECVEERLEPVGVAVHGRGDEPSRDTTDLVDDDPVAVRDRPASLYQLAVARRLRRLH